MSVFRIELNEVAVIEELIYHGWLSPEDQDDRAAILAAFSSADMTLKVLPWTAVRVGKIIDE